ncbi:hypothetical protein BBP40_007136 [Aspergillus hancockii]|nr:hypothetical protein BBP40_007136 [Aspergillus hancockii]
MVGASMTAVGFVTTVAAVHVVHYEPGFALVKGPGGLLVEDCNENDNHEQGNTNSTRNDRDDLNSHSDEEEDHDTTRTLQLISLISIFAAGVAGTALILLAVMDTFRYKAAHHIFLRLCFAGLAIQSALTAIVYSNEVIGFVSYVYHMRIWHHDWGRKTERVRVFASLSTALILVEVFLAVAFLSLIIPEENPSYREAGILEWIIAFLGTVYLWLFCGFLDRTNFDGFVPSVLYNPPEQRNDIQTSNTPQNQVQNEDPERTPLIGKPTGGRYT